MASASTVAVVVPSPATSDVFDATSRTIWAPMFWYAPSSSISLATETPSLVTVGEPHFLSITTLRPRGPSVTLTALARVSTPSRMALRASSLNSNCFAAMEEPPESVGRVRDPVGVCANRIELGDHGQDVVLAQDHVLATVDLD